MEEPETVICPECETEFDWDDRIGKQGQCFCPRCGADCEENLN